MELPEGSEQCAIFFKAKGYRSNLAKEKTICVRTQFLCQNTDNLVRLKKRSFLQNLDTICSTWEGQTVQPCSSDGPRVDQIRQDILLFRACLYI